MINVYVWNLKNVKRYLRHNSWIHHVTFDLVISYLRAMTNLYITFQICLSKSSLITMETAVVSQPVRTLAPHVEGHEFESRPCPTEGVKTGSNYSSTKSLVSCNQTLGYLRKSPPAKSRWRARVWGERNYQELDILMQLFCNLQYHWLICNTFRQFNERLLF
jgi:hypothetical protein